MDLSKLEMMSTDALQALRDKCHDILRARSMSTIRIGRIGWFIDSRGDKRFIRIIRVNSKTVSGVEVDSLTHMEVSSGYRSWRVSPSLLNIIDTSPAAKVAPSAVAHKPTTSASAW